MRVKPLMKDETENSLADRAREGDKVAMGALIDRYNREIFYFIYKMTRNVEDAKDLTQEVFIKVFRKLPGFRGKSSFRTWLYRVATNHTINFINRRPPAGYSDPLATLSDSGPLPSERLEKKDLKHCLDRAIDRLPKRQKAIVALRVQQMLSYREIAGILKCSVGNCKSAYHNAVINLREMIKDETGL